MTSSSAFYLEHIQKSASGFRAMWYPGTILKIGDVVKIDRYGVPEVQTSLDRLDIIAKIRIDESTNEINYSSGNKIEITAKAIGSLPIAGSILTEADAGFNIRFNNDKSVIFTIGSYKTHQIINLDELEEAILNRLSSGNWKTDWLVVYNLIAADSATIIIAEKGGTSLDLKASGAVKAAELKITDAALGLSVAKENGSTEKFISQGGLTPLYKVRGLVNPLWGKPHLGIRALTKTGEEEHFSLQEISPDSSEKTAATEIDESEL